MSNDAVHSDDSFVHDTLTNGGASRHAGTGAPAPSSGYMVGGATNAEGAKYHEQALKVNDFHAYAVAQHAAGIQQHFGSAVDSGSIYQGSWRENRNKVVLDASNHLPDRLAALRLGRDRGERAIYDIGKGKDIPTAGAHKAGAHRGEPGSSATPDNYMGDHSYQGQHTAGVHKAGSRKGAYSLRNDLSRRPLGAHQYEGQHVAGSHKA